MCHCLRSAEREGWGEIAKANFTKLSGSRGAQAGRPEQRLRGSILSSLGAYGWRERRGEKRPTSTIAEKVEKKTSRSVGFVFFTKTAKAVEATVCIGKMSLEGAKKHMWD